MKDSLLKKKFAYVGPALRSWHEKTWPQHMIFLIRSWIHLQAFCWECLCSSKNLSSFCCPYLVIILAEWTFLSFLISEQFEEYLVDSFKDLEKSTPEFKGTSSISVLDMKWLSMGLEKWPGGYKNTPLLTRTQVEVPAPTLGDSEPPMNNSSPWESYTLSSFLGCQHAQNPHRHTYIHIIKHWKQIWNGLVFPE